MNCVVVVAVAVVVVVGQRCRPYKTAVDKNVNGVSSVGWCRRTEAAQNELDAGPRRKATIADGCELAGG